MNDDDFADGQQSAAAPPATAKRPLIPTLKPWARWVLCGFIGIVAGVAWCNHSLRAGRLDSMIAIGPWTTSTNIGNANTSAKNRAVVAMYGLLALPPSEARYYTAETDDSGQPLDGRCRYRISGGPMPTKWWSLTIYGTDDYLVKNEAGIYSLESASLGPDEQARWNAVVAPEQQPGHWLPSGGGDHFILSLRNYLPADGGTGNLARNQLPAITREAC